MVLGVAKTYYLFNVVSLATILYKNLRNLLFVGILDIKTKAVKSTSYQLLHLSIAKGVC